MLVTARLVLKPHSIDAVDDYVRLWAPPAAPDPAGVPTFALTAEESWSRLLRFVGHWAVFGFGPFIVVEQSTGIVVGEAGYGYFRRGFGAHYDHDPEAMWKILPERCGRGFAGEAMAVATAALDEAGLGSRSVCIIDPRNTPSMRIAERLGFTPFAEHDYRSARRLLLERVHATDGASR